ncbi:MAG: hypothetical protein AB2L12_12260 [Smithellaceae bacterium]
MNFKLIYPKWEKLDRQTRFTLPPHGPVVFAATLPDYVNVEFIDENIQEIDFDQAADFVGISVIMMTPEKLEEGKRDIYPMKKTKSRLFRSDVNFMKRR